MKLLVINGPNINFLGIREKTVYGNHDYEYLKELIQQKALKETVEIDIFQSNGEGEIIDRIQAAFRDVTKGIIINPGAYTHNSYAIRDALASIDIPIIEVHISNVHKREEFRHISVTAPVCTGQIVGMGLNGYVLAVDQLIFMA
ncbi:MAG: type II 3-dehydroquinate dehydratase [Anaerocolumna sp.]